MQCKKLFDIMIEKLFANLHCIYDFLKHESLKNNVISIHSITMHSMHSSLSSRLSL